MGVRGVRGDVMRAGGCKESYGDVKRAMGT